MRPNENRPLIRGFGGLIGERWAMATGLHPEGMSAISRGLSEATPPEEV